MNVGFLSYKFGGIDGVSLTDKTWIKALDSLGHKVTLCSGKFESDTEGYQIPLLYHMNPRILSVQKYALLQGIKPQQLVERITKIAKEINESLENFINRNHIEALAFSNMLSIAMNIPAGIALSRLIEDKKIKTVTRHCDFWWERARYINSPVEDILEKYFPPKLDTIKHVVINSKSQQSLLRRKKINSIFMPDLFDFEYSEKDKEEVIANFKNDFNLEDDDFVILQPSRIVERKRVDRGIKLAAKLHIPFTKVIITGYYGDEGNYYYSQLLDVIDKYNVETLLIHEKISGHTYEINGNRFYSIYSTYRFSDLVVYLSEIEGFGNQFVETMFFKKPIVINNYKVYEEDIRPLGFKCIEVDDGKITPEVVDHIEKVTSDARYRNEMIEHNFELARQNYSIKANLEKFKKLLA